MQLYNYSRMFIAKILIPSISTNIKHKKLTPEGKFFVSLLFYAIFMQSLCCFALILSHRYGQSEGTITFSTSVPVRLI